MALVILGSCWLSRYLSYTQQYTLAAYSALFLVKCSTVPRGLVAKGDCPVLPTKVGDTRGVYEEAHSGVVCTR